MKCFIKFLPNQTPNERRSRPLRSKRSSGADDPRVFISYARADSHIASILADELQSVGTVFLDVDTIAVGNSFEAILRETIEQSDVVVALMSPAYFNSKWAQAELSAALEAGKRLLPVRLSGRPEGPLAYLQYLDVADASESELAAQVADLVRGTK